jgi:hypothetical protein
MTKKDIGFLFFPTIFFAVILWGATITHNDLRRHLREGDSSRPKFDAFVGSVQSGKLQLTSDKWLDIVRHERAAGDSYLQAAFSIDEVLVDIIWASLFGILLQTAVVYLFWKRLKKRMMPNEDRLQK